MKSKRTVHSLLMLGGAFWLPSLGSGVAFADAGDHIRLGDAELIPSIELRAVRRSNVYLSEGASTTSDGVQVGSEEQSGTALRLHTGLRISLNGEATSLDFNVDYQAV